MELGFFHLNLQDDHRERVLLYQGIVERAEAALSALNLEPVGDEERGRPARARERLKEKFAGLSEPDLAEEGRQSVASYLSKIDSDISRLSNEPEGQS